MSRYRLLEDLPGYGLAGQSFSPQEYSKIPYHHKVLLELSCPQDFIFFLQLENGHRRWHYLFQELAELTTLVKKLHLLPLELQAELLKAAAHNAPFHFQQGPLKLQLSLGCN